jgi:penicillin-binding protein 2
MKRSEADLVAMRRIAALAALMFAGLCALGVALWRMQLGQGSRYEASLDEQSVRRVRIPGFRGRMFDRHGTALAENEPNYCIVIYLEEARRAGRRGRAAEEAVKLVERVAEVIGREPEVDMEQVRRHLFSRRVLPLIAWRNIDEQAMARLAESGMNLPALDVVALPSRRYPLGAAACHVLGYVGSRPGGARDDESDDPEDHYYYAPDMEGRRGLEKRYDSELAGAAGGVIVRVDVSGF